MRVDVGEIRYSKLKERGIKAIIFDKDNTLTTPYRSEWHTARIADVVSDCKAEFGAQNVAICSNTAGSKKDRVKHNYALADEIQVVLDLKVIHHDLNKPLTPVTDILDHFQSFREGEIGQERFLQPHEIAVIGDRSVGDILWGNAQGFLTIKTEPLTSEGENFAVRFVRYKSSRFSNPLFRPSQLTPRLFSRKFHEQSRSAESGISKMLRLLKYTPPNHQFVQNVDELEADLTFPPMAHRP